MLSDTTKPIEADLTSFFHYALPYFSKLIKTDNDYSVALSILDYFKLSINFVHTNDYIEIPVKETKYYSPSENRNFDKELAEYLQKNMSVNHFCNSSEENTINFDLLMNFDSVDSLVLFNNYSSHSVFYKYICNLYFFKVVEILNGNNIKFFKEDIEYDEFIRLFNYNTETEYRSIANDVMDNLKINQQLCDYSYFNKSSFWNTLRDYDLKSFLTNRVIFKASELSTFEQIAYSYIALNVETFKDSLYFKELLEYNNDNILFLGNCAFHIFKSYREENKSSNSISKGHFLFVYKALNLMGPSDFTDKYPDLSQEELLIINNYTYNYEAETFEASMAHIS